MWLYYRFNLSHRGYGDTFYFDEVFIKIQGKQYYLWRAVDQESLPTKCFGYGEVVDVLSHQPIRVRERGMRRFKSVSQAQRFLSTHAAVYNLFSLGRHHLSAKNYRLLRLRAFVSWKIAVAA